MQDKLCNEDLLITTTVAQVKPKNVTAPTAFRRHENALDGLLAQGADPNPVAKGNPVPSHRIFCAAVTLGDELRGSPIGKYFNGKPSIPHQMYQLGHPVRIQDGSWQPFYAWHIGMTYAS